SDPTETTSGGANNAPRRVAEPNWFAAPEREPARISSHRGIRTADPPTPARPISNTAGEPGTCATARSSSSTGPINGSTGSTGVAIPSPSHRNRPFSAGSGGASPDGSTTTGSSSPENPTNPRPSPETARRST